ncbi:hypothetical protein FRC09_006980 [Ceratobasidium sp. 395]|nr:hypothetical protein FRC09_006980 [Ceratobasidium sp. 395]
MTASSWHTILEIPLVPLGRIPMKPPIPPDRSTGLNSAKVLMSSMLPPDVVRCVAEQLHDSPTLASLCLLDTRCYDLVLPLLYSAVWLATPESIESFCNTITQLNKRLGIYTSSLRIDPPDHSSDSLKHLATPIYLALQRTPNLKSLVLHIDTPSAIGLYHSLHLHAPKFSLSQLSCYATTPTHLLAFLATQPTITHLTLHDPRLALRPSGIRSVPPEVLPNLQFVHANPLTIHAFVPGRPVTRVDSGSMVLFNATTYLFCAGLMESTSSLGVEDVSVCIPKTKFWTGASDFIFRLASSSGSSVKRLKLRMPDLRVWTLELGGYAVLIEVLAASLGGFTKLEHFQFEGDSANIPPAIVTEDLGKAGKLAFWADQCPSLRSVTLFGADLS